MVAAWNSRLIVLRMIRFGVTALAIPLSISAYCHRIQRSRTAVASNAVASQDHHLSSRQGLSAFRRFRRPRPSQLLLTLVGLSHCVPVIMAKLISIAADLVIDFAMPVVASMTSFGSNYLTPPWSGMPAIADLPDASLKLASGSFIAIPKCCKCGTTCRGGVQGLLSAPDISRACAGAR
jgi:hypothetical protein